MTRLAQVVLVVVIAVIAALPAVDSAVAEAESTQPAQFGHFETAQQESLYTGLIGELRCLVCANQSLSDSNADLAKDLRGKVREMVARGRSRAEIIDYLVNRYGEYVLYRPRFSPATFFLWVGPFLAVLAGFVFILIITTGKSRRRPEAYSAEQLQRARTLLEDDRD